MFLLQTLCKNPKHQLSPQSNNKNRLLFVSSTKAVHNTLAYSIDKMLKTYVLGYVVHPAVAFRFFYNDALKLQTRLSTIDFL